MSWRKNNGKDRGHIDGIGHFLKGPNNNSESGVRSVDSSGAYITVDPSGVNGVAISLNLGLPDTSGNILASTDAGVLYWKTDISGVSSVDSSGTYIKVDPSGSETGVAISLNLGLPIQDGYILSSTTAGVLSWIEDVSGGEATGPANSVQMKVGTTMDSIGYDNFIYNGETFTIDSSNLKLDMSAIAIGNGAGNLDQSVNTIAIGENAGSNHQKEDAIAIGRSAGLTHQGNLAIAIGYGSGNDNQKQNAVAIGDYAGGLRQSNDAIAIGTTAGETDQYANAIAIGREAGKTNQSNFAVAIGHGAGSLNQFEKSIIINATGTPLNNSIVSTCTIKPIREVARTVNSNINLLMYDKSTGEITQNSDGVNLGAYDLTVQNMTIGLGNNNVTTNTAVGNSALSKNTSGGVNNTAVGISTLSENTSGEDNTAVGSFALSKNISGIDNTAVGNSVLSKNTSGNNNTAVGNQALNNLTSGFENTAIGGIALQGIKTNSGNTAVGNVALSSNSLTGDNNTAIGDSAGKDCSGNISNCTFIGYQANDPNNISNTIVLGNSFITTLKCAAALTGPSDERDKKEIKPLSYGLNYITEINPVEFKWNMRDGGKIDIPEIGFIAQNLKQGQEKLNIDIPRLVNDNNPDKLEITPGYLIPILVKSVQELSEQLNDTNKKLEELTLKVNSL